MGISDIYGRTFKTLRVSLTNVCNLGCIYCVNSSDLKPTSLSSKPILDFNEIAEAIHRIDSITKLDTIRLTGGEPTLYKDIIPLIAKIRSFGIENIKMTSNGYLLYDLVPSLANAGLKEINISLDAVEQKKFKEISGRNNLDKILLAIDRCLQFGIKIKINAVILKGVNDNQILPLLEFSKERKITIRFLELMRMGPLHESDDFERYFMSEKEILSVIEARYELTPLLRKASATANYWGYGALYKFGIIANESSPFCQDCNRLRLDSYGNIFGCLSNDTAISIVDSLKDDTPLEEKLIEALGQKQSLKFKGSTISMMAIGG